MKQQKRDNLILLAIAALVVLVDQVSKHFVMTRLEEGQSWDIVSWLTPFMRITHVTNTGAAFGLFPKFGDFFIGVAIIVIVAIIIYQRYLPNGQWLVRAALGLQLGGAFGNLIDRLRWNGAVVDFMDLNFWPLRQWPVFNVADASIVTGVSLLAILMMWEERRERCNRQTVEC